MHKYKGKIRGHVGPMFGGKSTALENDVKKFQLAGYTVAVFKPTKDNRYSEKHIVTHDGQKIECINAHNMQEILSYYSEYKPDVIAIDEIQFIDEAENVVNAILYLLRKKCTIVYAGLDLDFKLKPFEVVRDLMPYTQMLHKHTAICVDCGNEATTSHRFVESDERVALGGKDMYKPLCLECYFKRNK